MYCKHCGKEIADDSNFCQHCGGEQDIILSKQSDNSEQNTIIKAEVKQSNDEDKQSDNTIGSQRAKKRTSYKYIGTHTNKTLIVQLLPHELKAIIHKTSNSTLFMESNKHSGD